MKRLKIGELLLKENLLTEAELFEALERQKVVKKKLGEILLDMNVISERELLRTLADTLQFEFIENPSTMIDIGMRDIVSSDFASAKGILPLYIQDGTLYFATDDPLDFITMQDLSMITGFDTQAVLSPKSSIEHGQGVIYSVTDEIDGVELTQDSKEKDLMQRLDSAPVVRMVNALIDVAYRVNASDIHIEPEQDSTRIRFRVDGTLSEHMVLKKELHELVTTRIKIISVMNIAEKKKTTRWSHQTHFRNN